LTGIDLKASTHASISLANIGEFAFVLANDGLETGFLDHSMYKVLLGSAAVSLLISPLITTALRAAFAVAYFYHGHCI